MSALGHDLARDLVDAHRILVRENVLDAFGHVSLRDPGDPDRFWLARVLPPSLVLANDFLCFALDGEPVEKTGAALFSERWIHSEIYAARPDVHAVCHHHAPSILPFCIAPRPLVATTQTGAFLGQGAPLWDSADEFGATRLLVDTREQAASLARSLGDASIVLMRGHGATVAGRSLRDVVFKSVYACRDAEAQLAAAALGATKPLSKGETELGRSPADPALERCWTHWKQMLPAGGSGGPRNDEGQRA